MESLTPAEIAAKYAAAGEGKAKRATSLLVVLGILAGALIALGSAATNTAVYGIDAVWTARTICGLLFPFGLGMVVIMGAELTRDARHWYLRKANAGGLSKAELLEMIESAAHLEKSLDAAPDTCYTDKKRKDSALRRHAAIVSQRQPFQSLFVVPLYDVLLRFIHRKKRRSLHARC